jgi:hypothetical protein
MAAKKTKSRTKKKIVKKVGVAKKASRQRSVSEEDLKVEKEALSALKNGPKTNRELKDQLLSNDSVLGRTLQRLRRQGKIKVVNGRWTTAQAKICPKCQGRGFVEK